MVAVMTSVDDALSHLKLVSVGVFAHNEAATVDACVSRLLAAEMPDENWILWELIVVVSGDDGTATVVREKEAVDNRVQLVRQPNRNGKAAAINMFLTRATGDVLVLSSADVVLERGALADLLVPLEDPSVGMTGGVVRPVNPRHGLTNQLVHLLWDVHHRVASRTPKLGECVALRRVFDAIEEGSTVDEVSMEAEVVRHGLALRYVPSAVIYNCGPTRLPDYVRHRLRIHRGHLAAAADGYSAATFGLFSAARAAIGYVVRRPWKLPVFAAAAGIELSVRLFSRFLRLSKGNPQSGAWTAIASAKAADVVSLSRLELVESA